MVVATGSARRGQELTDLLTVVAATCGRCRKAVERKY